MKKLLSILIIVMITMFVVTGCSENDSDSTGPVEILAYSLDQFIPADNLMNLFHDDDQDAILEDGIEIRNLFSIHVVASDGWSWRSRGMRDLKWDEFASGYLIPEDEGKIYIDAFASQGVNTYNVKYAQDVDVYRTFELVKPDDTNALYQLSSMTTEQVENYDGAMEDAIKLTDFIPAEITTVDSVMFTAADGYAKTYSTDEFNAGYWLKDSAKTIFPGLDLPGSKKKFKFLKTITVYGDQDAVEDPFVSNFSDTPDYDMVFPEDLSDFDSIVWEGK